MERLRPTSTHIATFKRPFALACGLPAAVDADGLAGDEGGVVGGEEGDHRRDLVWGAEAADRDRFRALGKADFEVVAIFAAVGADRARGADRAGADGVYGDPDRREVQRQGFGEADDCRFRGRIGSALAAGAKRSL